MKIPDNFVLLVLAIMVGILRHWFAELDSLLCILLLMIRPHEDMIPNRDCPVVCDDPKPQ